MYLEDLKKLNAEFDEKKFLDDPLHNKAKQDFKYLCNKSGYTTFNNLNYQSLKTADSENKYLGEFLVIGFNSEEQEVKFPKYLLPLEQPNYYVVVVAYKGHDVANIFVFGSDNFKNTGMFSMFKDLKKTSEFGISLKDVQSKKLEDYSFGYVLKNLSK